MLNQGRDGKVVIKLEDVLLQTSKQSYFYEKICRPLHAQAIILENLDSKDSLLHCLTLTSQLHFFLGCLLLLLGGLT